ncbi:hypothetical protein M378DRAFT_169282 [Amanita muscaria Koide BX008]|uniref:Uncharacterized protein n=1 Tax=Amanita muscaria (strain Koide BX008) TaxID=946122 RepID=A0A0C2S9M7_AMAMK|nr:hypothetical protein M378DRAFT_169282 [Amanita muscaria Koide BX008]
MKHAGRVTYETRLFALLFLGGISGKVVFAWLESLDDRRRVCGASSSSPRPDDLDDRDHLWTARAGRDSRRLSCFTSLETGCFDLVQVVLFFSGAGSRFLGLTAVGMVMLRSHSSSRATSSSDKNAPGETPFRFLPCSGYWPFGTAVDVCYGESFIEYCNSDSPRS